MQSAPHGRTDVGADDLGRLAAAIARHHHDERAEGQRGDEQKRQDGFHARTLPVVAMTGETRGIQAAKDVASRALR